MTEPDSRSRAERHAALLNRRLRQEFVKGAEEQMQLNHGRGLTAEELERVLRHYPGDWPTGGNERVGGRPIDGTCLYEEGLSRTYPSTGPTGRMSAG